MKKFFNLKWAATAVMVAALVSPQANADANLSYEDYLRVSPQSVAYDQLRTPRQLRVVHGESLIDDGLDARFHFVNRHGQGNGLLIEFDDRCEGLQRGPATNAALTNRCVGSRVRFDFFRPAVPTSFTRCQTRQVPVRLR